MKLAKLSLAAVIAVGAFSFANATPLENAIKGVDLSGFVRLRFYNDAYKKSSDLNDTNRWRGSSIFKFTIPASDTIKIHYDVLAEQNTYSNGNQFEGKEVTGTTVSNNHIYLAYSNAGLNVIAGRIPVSTSITGSGYDEALGSGVITTYGLGNGFTVAGAFTDDLENLDQLGDIGNDLFALAGLYNSNMVDAQVWAYRVTNGLKYDYTISATVKPVNGLSLKGDYAASKEYGDGANNHNFWDLSATYAANGLSGTVGYADTNKNSGLIVTDNDAPIGNITGEQRYNIANMTDTDAWYTALGYQINTQTSVKATYNHINDKTVDNVDSDEYVFYANYAYNKKLSFRAYYSVLNYKNDATGNDDNELQLQTVYKF